MIGDHDFYSRVPKEYSENIDYRLRLRRRASGDRGFQRAIMSACEHDVLFFFSALCWLYEPRPRKGRKKVIPMIPWEHQEEPILKLRKHLGHKDIGWEKSRGEGASWIAILMAVHDFLFHDMSQVGLVSRNERLVDNPKDPASLFWKLDFELEKLPSWMTGVKGRDYVRVLSDHTLNNNRNGSVLVGEAATGNVGRAGRYTWFLMDELAFFNRGDDQRAVTATHQSSDSRLFISTANGSDGSFYNIMNSAQGAMERITLHWSQNPSKNRGLYRIVDGVFQVEDAEANPLPANYEQDSRDLFSRLRTKGFPLEGRWRSPWYDEQCDRAGSTPQDIAQELDIDYAGSRQLVFRESFHESVKNTSRNPISRGVVRVHPETLEMDFEALWDGDVLLWTELDVRGRPPSAKYAIGVDVSQGGGGAHTSNSVIEVMNLDTGEQVMEYAVNTIPPPDFADIAIGVAKWFHGAYLAWEHNGPGAAFTSRVLERGYGHIYRRTSLWKGGGRKKTREAGWWTDGKTKQVMFAELERSVKSGDFVIRSKAAQKESKQYVMKDGKIIHAGSAATEDDSARGEAHGDRIIALGVMLQASLERPGTEPESPNSEPPPYSMAARHQSWMKKSQAEDGWDDRIPGVSQTRYSSLRAGSPGWED